jgi:tetratricopeptide (TPR) repeat protein
MYYSSYSIRTIVLFGIALASCARGVSRSLISNPFSDVRAPASKSRTDSSQGMILRTKKGDQAVELEVPVDSQGMSDFVVPTNRFMNKSELTEESGIDNSYKDHRAGLSDREIAQTMAQGSPQDAADRKEIEQVLNLRETEDESSLEHTPSYLSSVDRIKQLYHASRYEAALIETDELLRLFPTDPKLYEMRGTLLDRLDRKELAIKSWSQALKLDSKNRHLKRFIERKKIALNGGRL